MSTTPPPAGDPQAPQPFGAGGYPAHPGTPADQQPLGRGPAPEQPPSISLAVRLMQIGGVISLISTIVSLATIGGLKDDIRSELEKSDASVSQATVDAAFVGSIVFTVVFGLIGALLWFWMAWKNGQGRSWARIVATVFGGIAVLSVLGSLATGNAQPISLALALVNLVLAVVILIKLWSKESSAFYTAASAPRY